MYHVLDSMLLLSNDYRDFWNHFLKFSSLGDINLGHMRSLGVKSGQYLHNEQRNERLLILNRRLVQTSWDAAD